MRRQFNIGFQAALLATRDAMGLDWAFGCNPAVGFRPRCRFVLCTLSLCTLYDRSSTSHRIFSETRCLCF